MAMNSFSQFTEMQTSVLQELGNMGSGGAATALADMVGGATDISVPMVKKVSLNEAKALVTKLCSVTVSLLITLSGDFKGSILHLIPYNFAERVIKTYFPDASVKSAADMNEMNMSVINEMVNITTGAYVNSLAQLSSMFIDISTPASGINAAQEIMKNYPPTENVLYFVNNTMIIKDGDQKSNMLYFPELESVKTLMGKIGVPCD